MSEAKKVEVDVCIVGAGPAGMMLGLLLAQQGIKVLVLEHHKNFDREFRGEVLMPRFTQMLQQLNLFDLVEQYPHLKLNYLEGHFGHWREAVKIKFADISPEVPFAIWMSQPTLLGAIHDKAKKYSNFDIWFGVSVHGLIKDEKKTIGLQAQKDREILEIHAKLTVGADGRSSMIRKLGQFEMLEEDYQFDIIWFTMPKPTGYDNTVRFFLLSDQDYLFLPRLPNLIQCGMLVPKGEFARYRQKGIESIREKLLKAPSILNVFARELKDFSPFNVLQARSCFVKEWAQDGCLLIGDAAHTCSPVGAIGVSVAVATAIVAADVIRKAICANDVSKAVLSEVQRKRTSEVQEIQKIQKRLADTVFAKNTFWRFFAPMIMFLLIKTGIFYSFQRRLMVMKEPLAIDPGLSL